MAPTTPQDGDATAAEPLYFIRNDKLVAIIRRVRTEPTAQAHLGHLIAGPTAQELDAGLSSSLTGNAGIGRVEIVAGEAIVEVDDNGDDGERSDEILAFGQIVCTLTARADVRAVSFRQDGRRLGIPRADGSLSTDPLTAAQYAALTAPA